MSAAAIARPRLLRRPVSDAQRQASRRNAPCGAHTLVCGVKLHLFIPDEAAALHDETRFLIEAFRPAGPVALAIFQLRRIDRIEIDFQIRNPRDFLAIAGLIHSLGVIECRYDRLLHRCLCRLDDPDPEILANEPGNSLQQNNAPLSSDAVLRGFFPPPETRDGVLNSRFPHSRPPPSGPQRYTGTDVRPPQ